MENQNSGWCFDVVIPCNNVAGSVQRAVRSALAIQCVRRVICVENGSSDRTLDVLERLKSGEERIEIYTHNTPNANAARNQGLQHVATGYVLFLDADDELVEDAGEKLARFISAAPDADLHLGATAFQPLGGGQRILSAHKDVAWSLFHGECGNTSSWLFKTESVRKYLWNEELGSSQELELAFRMWKDKQILLPHHELIARAFDRVSGRISQKNPARRWAQNLHIRRDMLNFIQQNHSDYWERNKQRYEQFFFDRLRILSRYDLNEAHRLYKEVLGQEFKAQKSIATSSVAAWINNLLGFKLAEKLRKLLVGQSVP